MSKPSHPSPITLARITAGLKRFGITHAAVAAEASRTSRRGHVDFTTISHVLAGRRVSANVVATAKRLIAEAKAAQRDAPRTAVTRPAPCPNAIRTAASQTLMELLNGEDLHGRPNETERTA